MVLSDQALREIEKNYFTNRCILSISAIEYFGTLLINKYINVLIELVGFMRWNIVLRCQTSRVVLSTLSMGLITPDFESAADLYH